MQRSEGRSFQTGRRTSSQWPSGILSTLDGHEARQAPFRGRLVFRTQGVTNPREEEETRAGPTAGAARKGNEARGTTKGTRSSRSQQTTCRSFPRSYPAISAEKQRGFHRAASAGACFDGSCQLSRGCYHGGTKLPHYDAMDEFEGQGGCWLCLSY